MLMDFNVKAVGVNQSVNELQWDFTGVQFEQDQVSFRQQTRTDTPFFGRPSGYALKVNVIDPHPSLI